LSPPISRVKMFIARTIMADQVGLPQTRYILADMSSFKRISSWDFCDTLSLDFIIFFFYLEATTFVC